MASELNKAVENALGEFEKNHNEWEWSDLISWLQTVSKIIEKYEEFLLSESNLYVLAKRLSQCLNPTLPQGLHTKTLEIYKKILADCEIVDFPIFSSGLLAMFPNFATENKAVFFDIVETIYLTKIEKIACILPGLIRSLLSGAEDRAESFNKAKEIIEKFSETHLIEVQSSVWQFVIASDSYRIIGLKYMMANFQSDFHQELAVKGVLKSFEDEQVLVKRQALDVVKTHFKLCDPLISEQIKVSLMEGALRLLRFRDLTLMRRVWDWVFNYEEDETLMKEILKIIASALEAIFSKHELEMEKNANLDMVKLNSIRIVDLLVENENNGLEIIESIGVIYLKHIVNADLSTINGKNDGRACLVFLEEKGPILWKNLNKYLIYNINKNQEECVKMLKYALKNISFDLNSIILVLNTLLLSLEIRNLPDEIISVAISIADEILESQKEDTQDFPIEGAEHIESLFLDLHWFDMLLLSKLLGSLEKLGYTSTRAVKKIRTCEVDFLYMMELLSDIRSYSISEIEIHILWEHYHSENESKVVDLLLKIQPLVPDVWTESLVYLLEDPLEKAASIRKFSEFWSLSSHLPELGKCLEDGHAIYILIDQLNNENTLISQSAHQWLLTAISKISYLLDPLYNILFNRSTKRKGDGNYYIYIYKYDTERVIEVLKKIKILIESSKEVPKQMDEVMLSENSKDLILYHNLTLGSYLEILVDILVIFINSNSKKEKTENKTVEAFACEVLQELVKYLPSPLAFKALEGSVACLHKSIISENGEIQFLLLKEIENILHFCEIENEKRMCVKIFQSVIFSSSIEKGLHTQDAYLREHWVKFITEIIPYLMEFLGHPVLTNYLKSLLSSYSVLIVESKDHFLIEGLKDLIHFSLGITSKFTKKNFEPIIHESAKTMVFKELQTIISVCVYLYNHHKPEIRNKFQNIDIDVIDEISKLFTPISNNYQEEFLFSLINVWGVYCEDEENSQENLTNLLRLIPSMNISLEGFIDAVCLFLEEGEKGVQIVHAAHFLYSLLEIQTISIIRLRNLEKIWKKILLISKNLINSDFEESIAILISLFFVLSNQVFGFHYLKEKKTIKQIKETIEIAISKGCEYSLDCSKTAEAIPYPGIDYWTDISVYEVILLTLIDKEAQIIDFYFKDTEKSIEILHLQSCMFIAELSKATYGTYLASELVLKFVLHYKKALLKKIKKEIFECITGSNFYKLIKSEEKTLSVWLKIANSLSAYYSEKNEFLEEILNKFQGSFFTRSKQAQFLHKNSLFMISFVLLSGNQDDYITSINTIIEYIKKSLHENEFFPFLTLLIRTIMIRFNYGIFLGMWSNIWPDLQFLLIENFYQSKDCEKAMAALKLIDTMLTMDFEETYRIIWMFTFDINQIKFHEGQNRDFLPMFTRNNLLDYSARPIHIKRNKEGIKELTKKKPLLLKKEAQSFEHLNKHYKNLIKHSIHHNSTRSVPDLPSINESIEFDLKTLSNSLSK